MNKKHLIQNCTKRNGIFLNAKYYTITFLIVITNGKINGKHSNMLTLKAMHVKL
jgi:hypothetical protein